MMEVFLQFSSMDMFCSFSRQTTMNLEFEDSVASERIVTIKDNDENEIIRFCADSADFINGTERRFYLAAIVSHPSFKKNGVYHLFMNGTQLGFIGSYGAQ